VLPCPSETSSLVAITRSRCSPLFPTGTKTWNQWPDCEIQPTFERVDPVRILTKVQRTRIRKKLSSQAYHLGTCLSDSAWSQTVFFAYYGHFLGRHADWIAAIRISQTFQKQHLNATGDRRFWSCALKKKSNS
jgi:hypothetical protein